MVSMVTMVIGGNWEGGDNYDYNESDDYKMMKGD